MTKWLNTITGREYAGVSEPTFSAWLQDGLKHCRISRNMVRTKPEWIDEYIEQFLVEGSDESKIEALLRDFR